MFRYNLCVYLPYFVNVELPSLSHIALTVKSRFVSDKLVSVEAISTLQYVAQTIIEFHTIWNDVWSAEEGARLQEMLNKEVDAYVERLRRTGNLSFPGGSPGELT